MHKKCPKLEIFNFKYEHPVALMVNVENSEDIDPLKWD
jgi:hypothetical protein